MQVTKVTITTTVYKKPPAVGDIRTTKKYGREVRVRKIVTDMFDRPIGYQVSNGKPCYEWVAINAQNIKKHNLEYLKLEVV